MPLPENKVAKENKVITAGDHMIADGLQFQIESFSHMEYLLTDIADSLNNFIEMFGEHHEFFLTKDEREKSFMAEQKKKLEASVHAGDAAGEEGKKVIKPKPKGEKKAGMFDFFKNLMASGGGKTGIMGKLLATSAIILGLGGAVVMAYWEEIKVAWDAFSERLAKDWENTKLWIGDNVFQPIDEFAENISNTTAFKKAVDFTSKEIWPRVFEAYDTFVDWKRNTEDDIWRNIEDFWNNAKTNYKEFAKEEGGVGVYTWKKLHEGGKWLGELQDKVVGGVVSAMEGAKKFQESEVKKNVEFAEAVRDTWKGFSDKVKDETSKLSIYKISDDVAGEIKEFGDNIGTSWNTMVDDWRTSNDSFWGKIDETINNLKTEGPEGVASWLKDSVKDVWGSVAGWFKKGMDWLKKTFTKSDAEKEAAAIAKESELKSKISEEQARIDRSNAGENEYVGFEGAGQKASENRIKMMEHQLESLQIEMYENRKNLAKTEPLLEKPITSLKSTTEEPVNAELNGVLGKGQNITGAALSTASGQIASQTNSMQSVSTDNRDQSTQIDSSTHNNISRTNVTQSIPATSNDRAIYPMAR